MVTIFRGEGEEMGVIPRALQDIFKTVETRKDWKVQIKVSFMELYQEKLYDLLSNKKREDSIVDIRDDAEGQKIPDLTDVRVSNSNAAFQCLTNGAARRKTGATAMNAQSSRSKDTI